MFVLTVVTTTMVGALHYFGFNLGFNSDAVVLPNFSDPALYPYGLWYSATFDGMRSRMRMNAPSVPVSGNGAGRKNGSDALTR